MPRSMHMISITSSARENYRLCIFFMLIFSYHLPTGKTISKLPVYKIIFFLSFFQDAYMYSFESGRLHVSEYDVDTTTGLTAVTDDVLTTYINSEALSKYLFPHERVIVDFVPFRLMDSNIPFMSESSEFLEVFSDIRTEDGAYKGLLSFGSLYKVKTVPYRYALDVYGTDSNSLKSHTDKHLMRMKRKASVTTTLVVILDKTFKQETVEETLKQLGGTQSNDDPDSGYHYQQLLFEKNLQMN